MSTDDATHPVFPYENERKSSPPAGDTEGVSKELASSRSRIDSFDFTLRPLRPRLQLTQARPHLRIRALIILLRDGFRELAKRTVDS